MPGRIRSAFYILCAVALAALMAAALGRGIASAAYDAAHFHELRALR